MYSYTWDSETGGLLLESTSLTFSREPRPVYYKELDVLGFDRYMNYAKDNTAPYMWAEANNYYYRGRKVAQVKGGSVYKAPDLVILEEPEPDGTPLRPVDIPAMVEKNSDLLEKIAADTIKRIYNTYVEYSARVDVFYVAFSGGKDSIVLLDLAQRALPHNGFNVLFGDTGMEFPDTYKAVDAIEAQCREKGITFMRAKSAYTPQQTWRLFGPPATVTRWCCSVHKTAPQILLLREYTAKSNFTGMAFIGVRAGESAARSEYDYISLGKKHKGQYNCHPILEWGSAELYLYIYARGLYMNEAYRKGNRRVGCLVCPRAAERNDYMSRVCYPTQFDSYINTIRSLYKGSFTKQTKLDEFIANGGWKARKSGRDLSLTLNYEEFPVGNRPGIHIHEPRTNWKEWIKTIGVLLNDASPYQILFGKERYTFEVEENEDGEIRVSYTASLAKEAPSFIKLLKNVFRKAACCIRCRECEADCHNGCISMKDGQLHISDACRHCAQCHKVEKGCLIYKSLEMPNTGSSNMKSQSLNRYSHFAPERSWFTQFFQYEETFDENHKLGPNKYRSFKTFLRDAALRDRSNRFTTFAARIKQIGLDDPASWALMLTNLAYTSQIHWLVKRIPLGETMEKEYVCSLLLDDGTKESVVGDIWTDFKRLLQLPFAEVGLGAAEMETGKNKMRAITKTAWSKPAPRVVLYALYKFAEACGGYYQFTLSRLLDHGIESNGVSPTEIFGIDREQMERILNGLSVNYPQFISSSFTLNLDSINLNTEQTSQDVLELF